MKLPALVDHTHYWLGIPHTTIGTFGRVLREARLISVGTTGGGAADMTPRDSAMLLLAVCGISTARQSFKAVPAWLEKADGIVEHIEGLISRAGNEAPEVEFDVDGYCARFAQSERTRTFGKRVRGPAQRPQSFLVRQIPGAVFSGWLEGLR